MNPDPEAQKHVDSESDPEHCLFHALKSLLRKLTIIFPSNLRNIIEFFVKIYRQLSICSVYELKAFNIGIFILFLRTNPIDKQ
jgi:hypothetical protein